MSHLLKKSLTLVSCLGVAVLVAACGGGTAGSLVTGSITGSLASSGLRLSNGLETITISPGATQFSFARRVDAGQSYAIRVESEPDDGLCAVAGKSGSGVATGSVINVVIDCLEDAPGGHMTDAQEALLTIEPRAPNPDAPYVTEEIGGTEVALEAGAIRPLRAVAVPPPTNPTTISGRVTFQRVFQKNSSSCASGGLEVCGLNFANPITLPSRFIRIEAVSAADGTTLLDTTNTDANGAYTLTVSQGASVLVRAYSQITSAANKSYQFTVVDNTSNNAIYVVQNNQTVVANSNQTGVDINTTLGYDAEGNVTGARLSAPFSILDDLSNFSDAIITAGGSSVSTLFASRPLVINWSINNVPTDGDKTKGFISTSNYDGKALNILGKADNDTDEFDIAVMGHEWGHWMQSIMSNSDNPGGSHASGEVKDYSLAYGEGWGTGFSSGLVKAANIAAYNNAGIVGYYYDTSGRRSQTGSATNMSNMPAAPNGAFNENSVGFAVYNIMNQNQGGLAAFVATIQDMRTRAWGATIIGFAASYYQTTQTSNASAVSAMLTNLSSVGITFSSGQPDGFGTNFVDTRLNANAAAGTPGLLTAVSATPAADFSQLYVPLTVGGSATASFTNTFKWGGTSANGLGLTRRWVASVSPSRSYRLCATGGGIDGQTVFWLIRGNGNYAYWQTTNDPTPNCTTFTTPASVQNDPRVAIALQYDATTIKTPDAPVVVTMTQL